MGNKLIFIFLHLQEKLPQLTVYTASKITSLFVRNKSFPVPATTITLAISPPLSSPLFLPTSTHFAPQTAVWSLQPQKYFLNGSFYLLFDSPREGKFVLSLFDNGAVELLFESLDHPCLFSNFRLQNDDLFGHFLVFDNNIAKMFWQLCQIQKLSSLSLSTYLSHPSVVWLIHMPTFDSSSVILILQMTLNLEGNYEVYQIRNQNGNYHITPASPESIHRGDSSYRKAIPSPIVNERQSPFNDPTFNLNLDHKDVNEKGQRYVMRRIYEIYDKQVAFLEEEFMKDLPLKPRKFYPTFLSQFSMIDKAYLNSMFFTKTLNAQGFYRYFVRRNGEYHVEFMDDWIPVEPDTRLPPWGLSQKEPWKIILMKAWLKEKRSIEAVLNADPYEFIDAFGFPGYRAISIQKEISHIATSNMKEEVKVAKEKRIPLDIPGFIVVGKTRNNQQVEELGLVPNRAGYRLYKTNRHQNKSVIHSNIRGSNISNTKLSTSEDNIYKIHSSLPSFWVGEYSIFANGKIQQPQVNKLASEIVNIENEFFASYYEISHVFSKFYICPEYTSDKLTGNLIQDSLAFTIGSQPKPFYFLQLKVNSSGFLNLNIQLPADSAEFKTEKGQGSKRYSYITYFMSRQLSKDNPADLSGYQYYDGEYMKGYHKSINRFIQIQKGTYYIYFKVDRNRNIQPNQMVTININSNAYITSFRRLDHRNPAFNFQFAMKSTLHNYNLRFGLKTYVGKSQTESKKNLIVYISHSFDDIGLGIVSIVSKPPTTMYLAMNVNQEVFRDCRMNLCLEAHGLRQGQDEGILNFSAKEGEASVLIVERSLKSRQVNEKFPPPDAVEFFHIL